MTTSAVSVVRTLWQFCNVLRDDGLSYPDYVEQLTYLLFLKMASDRSASQLPSGIDWRRFSSLPASEMKEEYSRALSELSRMDGTIGTIFTGASCKIRDPQKLKLLVSELIGSLDWSALPIDVKGEAYEGLLEKNARDTKSGAGQYFTPRPLVDAIVSCVKPEKYEKVWDPACGTGGFLLAAARYLDGESGTHGGALIGVELVEEVARLAAMNMVLHGEADPEAESPILCADSLDLMPSSGGDADVVLSNPPFGVRGSVTYTGESGRVRRGGAELTSVRADFWTRTSNKQLNFLQHIAALLLPGGRAAVVVPDNVLYEGGAAAEIRSRLVSEFSLHTLLRLPAGLFYATGVMANVLFFEKKPPLSDDGLWVYDLRTGGKYSLKNRPLGSSDLSDFLDCFEGSPKASSARGHETDRWRFFPTQDLSADGFNLDIKWSIQAADQSGSLDDINLKIRSNLLEALELLESDGLGR